MNVIIHFTIISIWKQNSHVMQYWEDTTRKLPDDFLSKFYRGHE